MRWRSDLLMVLLLQATSVLSSWIEEIHSASIANHNLRSFLNDGNMTFVAGVNYLAAINRRSSSFNVVNMSANANSLELCYDFYSKDLSTCINGLEVIQPYDADTLFICGSNAREPNCFYVNKKTFVPTKVDLKANQLNWLPNDPNELLTTLMTYDQSQTLYAASCATGTCMLLRMLENSLQTRGSWFDDPSYIDLYSSGGNGQGLVYLFFREKSNAFREDSFGAGGPKAEYGMVARVCQNDTGGGLNLGLNFATFMKVRLLCPFPGGSAVGSANLYYNYLNATARVGNIIYGIFRHPPEWHTKATAVCAFDLSSIDSILDGTAFPDGKTKYYEQTNTPGYVVNYDRAGSFYPGQCPPAGESTTEVDAPFKSFIKDHTLSGANVEPLNRIPTYASGNEDFNRIATAQVGEYHLLYIFKENGLMRKIRVNAADGTGAIVLAEAQISNENEKILSVSVADKSVLVVTKTRVISVPVAVCSFYTTCNNCTADPSCKWQRGCVMNTDSNQSAITSCLLAPSPPSNFDVKVSSNYVRLEWTSGRGGSTATGYYYEIIRRQDDVVIISDVVTNTNAQLDSQNLTPGVLYLAKVQAVNQAVSSDFQNKEFKLDLDVPVLTLTSATDTMVQVEWSKVDGAESYNITIYANGRLNEAVQSYIMKSIGNKMSTDSMAIAGLVVGTQYSVVVFGISVDGSHSNLSNFVNFTTTVVSTLQDEAITPSKTSVLNITTHLPTVTSTSTFISTSTSTSTSTTGLQNWFTSGVTGRQNASHPRSQGIRCCV